MLDGIDLVRKQTKQDNSIATLERIVAYRKKQQTLISKVHKKLIKNENVSIGFYGDSMTYGYDTVSADKRPNSVTDNAGNQYNVTIASTTFPEAFKKVMDRVYGVDTVTVKTRAIGGDYVGRALERWLPKTHPIGTDLCVMNYGINDSRNNNCPYVGDTDKFLEYYRELIEAELDNGTGVILMTPFKGRTTDYRSEIFENAIKNLAEEYGIPVIIGDEMASNMSFKYYSDGTHWNGKGYEMVGTRLASCFIGNGIFNPIIVDDNTQLLTRRQLDGIWWSPNDTDTATVSAASYPTPDEAGDKGGVAVRIGQDKTVYYTFYADKDLWIAPYLGFNSDASKAKVELNFGIECPDYTFDNFPMLGGTVDFTKRHISSITYTKDMPKASSRINVGSILIDELPCLRTITKGWHTVSISAVDGTMGLGGVIFLDINYFETIRTKYTKFRNNVEVKPETITEYRDVTVYREDAEALKTVRFGTNIKGNKVSATMCLRNEETKDVLVELSLKDVEISANKTIRIYPAVDTDAIAFSTVRKLADTGVTYYQNTGLFKHSSSIGVGTALYNYDDNKEIARLITTEDSVSASKMNGTTNPLPGEIDLGTNYYKFKDIYAVNGVIQTSDRNAKKEIKDVDIGLDFINKLRPVSFKFKDNQSDRVHTGLIAQEVEEILGDNDKAMLIKSNYIDEATRENYVSYSLRYNELIAPLIKAVQELSEEVQELKKEMNTIGISAQELEQLNPALFKRVGTKGVIDENGVKTENYGIKTLAYTNMLLVALQETMKKVELLEKEVVELKSKI